MIPIAPVPQTPEKRGHARRIGETASMTEWKVPPANQPRPGDYSFDLVRPGLSLYGGIPREEAEGHIRQIARVEAQIVQRRMIPEGESCGYGGTFVAEEDTEAAILNIGYADGYLRGFSSRGSAFAGEFALPVLGRDAAAVGTPRRERAETVRVERWRRRIPQVDDRRVQRLGAAPHLRGQVERVVFDTRFEAVDLAARAEGLA